MKHRSLIIFVVIVAALVVVPEAAQQLDEFKRTAVERASRGMSNAFLNLYAQHLKGQETRNVAFASSPEAKGARIETCSLTGDDATATDARRSSPVREKASTAREASRQRRSPVEGSAPEVQLAKNELNHLATPLELHADLSMLPQLSTIVAVQDMPEVAAVSREFIPADVVRALKSFEVREAPHAPSAPVWSRAEREAASRLARDAVKNARFDERRRGTRLKIPERHGDAVRVHSDNPAPQAKGYKLKARGTFSAPAATAPEATPHIGATPLETLIGF